jgi:hypothetical protein
MLDWFVESGFCQFCGGAVVLIGPLLILYYIMSKRY